MSFVDFLLWSSLGALVVTKLADLWTTLRHVSPHVETNPLVRWICPPLGFGQALGAVMLLWAIVVAVTYFVAFRSSSSHYQAATAVVGYLVSAGQAEAARLNVTRRGSWFTRTMIRLYHRFSPRR